MPRFFIVLYTAVAGLLPAVAQAGAPAAPESLPAFNLQAAGAAQLGVQDFIPPAPPVPQPSSLDELCGGEPLCFLDSKLPTRDGDRIGPMFDNYGQDLSKKEKKTVSEAFKFINTTFIGRGLCWEIAAGDCSLDALAASNVIFKAKVLAPDVAAEAKLWNGKVLIVINQNAKYDTLKPIDWAVVINHELSHTEDYKRFKSSMAEPHRIDTESKAYMVALQSYHELKNRYPRKIDDPVFNFLVEAWNWKQNGGPFPKDFVKDGKKIPAKWFIDYYLEPSKRGFGLIRNATKNYFYEDKPMAESFQSGDMVHFELIRAAMIRGASYNKWQKELLLYIPPAQPSGETGGPYVPPVGPQPSGHEWQPSFNPNPHFNGDGSASYKYGDIDPDLESEML